MLLLALLAVPSSAAAASSNSQPIPLPLASHSPILIEGDAGFTAAQGVVGGTGTPQDPYLIDGWDIDIALSDGIAVRNTTASLLVRNVTFGQSGAVPMHDGIRLFQVRNVRIENITVTNGEAGLDIRSSDNVTLARSVVLRSGVGVRVFQSTQVNLLENEVRADGQVTYHCVYIVDSDQVVLRANRLALDTPNFGNSEARLDNVTNVTFEHNLVGTDAWVPQFSSGVWLVDVLNATFRNNTFLSRGISPTPYAGASWSSFRHGPEIFDSYTITPDNTINGAPILFHNRCQDVILDGVAAGEIILANCMGVQVSNITFQGGQVGLVIAFSVRTLVVFNRFVDEGLGFTFWGSPGSVYHNDFVRSGYALIAAPSEPATRFDADYPAGGNYWSQVTGEDRCSGTRQDSCVDPDGMLDAAFRIFGTGSPYVDRYPLAVPINLSNTWPIASFHVEARDADVYTPIVFNASGSSDREDPANVLQIRWDFDGDGRWDTNWTSNKVVTHQFPDTEPHSVRVEVRDSDGLLSIATVTVQVSQFSGWRAPAAYLGIPSILLVAAVLAFLAYRRKRPRPGIPSSVPPSEQANPPGAQPAEGEPSHSEEREQD